MESRKLVFRQTVPVAAGQALCTAALIAVFALMGKYDIAVLAGGIAGALISTANFFYMALFADLAADKAAVQDVAEGQRLLRLSYTGRMLGLFAVLFLCAGSGFFNILTLTLPLVFTRPILTVLEFFDKKGGYAT